MMPLILMKKIDELKQQLQVAEQQNAQLRAECASMKAKLEEGERDKYCINCKYCKATRAASGTIIPGIPYEEQSWEVFLCELKPSEEQNYTVVNKNDSCKNWEFSLSTSSGKDMLEHMRVMREALEYYADANNWGKYSVGNESIRVPMMCFTKEALAKVKGGAVKNEWGEW